MRQDPQARRLLCKAAAASWCRPRADDNGSLRATGGALPGRRSEQRKTHFTRLTIARDKVAAGRWQARVETAPLVTTGVRLGSGTSAAACSPPPTMPAARRRRRADGRDLLDRHRLPPRAAQGRHLQRRLRVAQRRRRVVPWNEGSGRVLAAEFVNAGRTHQAVWFVDARAAAATSGLTA
jgi:hypothetical protein